MVKPKSNDIKKPVDELVDADGAVISGDRNATSDSEIETGPVQKPFNDDSDYEKGMSTTTDKAVRYRQDIPWFAVYSYGGTKDRATNVNEAKPVRLTKNQVEEDLVKKSKGDRELWDKNYDAKTERVLDILNDSDLTSNQLEKIKQIILDKLKNKDA